MYEQRLSREMRVKRVKAGFWPVGMVFQARIYILVVQVLGLAALLLGLAETLKEGDFRWVYLAALTVGGGLLAVRMTSGGSRAGSVTISLGDFFLLTAILWLGPAAAALVGAVEGLVSSYRVKVGQAYKILFNMAQLALAGFLTGSFFQLVGGIVRPLDRTEPTGLLGFLGVALVCAGVYTLINTLILGAVMQLVSGRIAPRGFVWALPTALVSAALVAVMLSVMTPIHLRLALALVPLLLVAYALRGVSAEEGGGLFSGRMFPVSLLEQAKGYLLVVVLTALPLSIYCFHEAVTGVSGKWWVLAGLTVISSCFPIRLFSLKDRIFLTLSDVFVFAALWHFGPEVAVVMAGCEAISFNLRRRPRLAYRWLFNVAHVILVAFVVAQLAQLVQGAMDRMLEPGLLVGLLIFPALCGVLYYALSSGLTALAVATTTRQSFGGLWVHNLGSCYVSALGAVVAAVGLFLLS